MIWCRRCLMPSTRPRIGLDSEGVCNACRYHETKCQIDWVAREAEFRRIVADHRGRVQPYDCVVPFSGGKDSATVAWRLREAGLRPLLVTYGQLLWTDVGRRNWHRVRDTGFDILYWGVDQVASRALARRFTVERGHPKQHYDAAVNAVPVKTALKFGIPLVFYAEHGETEYGGHILDEEHRRIRDRTEVLEHQVGDDAANWATDGLSEASLWPYIYPEQHEIDAAGLKIYYFSHFYPWDICKNAILAREALGFEQAKHYPTGTWHQDDLIYGMPGSIMRVKAFEPSLPRWWGKSDGSFEGFDSIDDMIDDLDYYFMHIKFGFGRAARMASRLIQNGHMTREQGIELVRRYDGEWPESYLPGVLRYLGMTESELRQVIDRHRNPEIWQRSEDAWRLRCPPM